MRKLRIHPSPVWEAGKSVSDSLFWSMRREKRKLCACCDLVAIQERLRVHGFLSCLLDKSRPDAISIPAPYCQSVVEYQPRIQAGTGPGGASSFPFNLRRADEIRPEDLVADPVQLEEGARYRREPVDQVDQLPRRPGEVEPAVLLLDLPGVRGGGLGRLRRRLQAVDAVDDVDHHLRAPLGELVVELPAGRPGEKRLLVPGEDRPRVHPLVELHDADAGRFVPGDDRPRQGRRAAPPRQEGGVDVQAAERLGLEDGLRQEQPVRRDAGDVGLDAVELALARLALQRLGREDRDAVLLRDLVDRGLPQLSSSSRRPRRLGVDCDDLVMRTQESPESRGGEFGRAHEHDLLRLPVLVRPLRTRIAPEQARRLGPVRAHNRVGMDVGVGVGPPRQRRHQPRERGRHGGRSRGRDQERQSSGRPSQGHGKHAVRREWRRTGGGEGARCCEEVAARRRVIGPFPPAA
mmetsp:Transcript_18880/g.46349  ORF Transcript_18880/g.46349 Transcript_18880/m.46349 type:complete len:463 (-) Transcript_18880:12-1400(-)